MCLEMLFFYIWSFLIQVIFVFKMTLAQESNRLENDSVKISFNELLKNIILVNEKRMQAIKKLAYLQDIDVRTRNRFKWLEEGYSLEDSSTEEAKNEDDKAIVTVFNVRDSPVQIQRTRSDEDSDFNNEPALRQFVILVRKPRHANNDINDVMDTNDNTNNIIDVNNEIDSNDDEIDAYDALDTNEIRHLNDAEIDANYDAINIIDVNNEIDSNVALDTNEVTHSNDAEIDANDALRSNDASDTINANLLDTTGIMDTNYITDPNDALDTNNVLDPIDVSIVRRAWHDACNRKAAKHCTRACKKAHTRNCKTFKCSKRSKRFLKKECKILCKLTFESGRNKVEE